MNKQIVPGCICSTYRPDDGRYDCSVSGDECMFMNPDAVACARRYGEGPLAYIICSEEELQIEKLQEDVMDLTAESAELHARVERAETERDAAYTRGVNHAIYETWKEADLPITTQDIRDNDDMTDDDKCADFARRISKYVNSVVQERDAMLSDFKLISKRDCLCACVVCANGANYDGDYYPCSECWNGKHWQWRGPDGAGREV